jgi:hypothetical protein
MPVEARRVTLWIRRGPSRRLGVTGLKGDIRVREDASTVSSVVCRAHVGHESSPESVVLPKRKRCSGGHGWRWAPGPLRTRGEARRANGGGGQGSGGWLRRMFGSGACEVEPEASSGGTWGAIGTIMHETAAGEIKGDRRPPEIVAADRGCSPTPLCAFRTVFSAPFSAPHRFLHHCPNSFA